MWGCEGGEDGVWGVKEGQMVCGNVKEGQMVCWGGNTMFTSTTAKEQLIHSTLLLLFHLTTSNSSFLSCPTAPAATIASLVCSPRAKNKMLSLNDQLSLANDCCAFRAPTTKQEHNPCSSQHCLQLSQEGWARERGSSHNAFPQLWRFLYVHLRHKNAKR